jgi:signal transduction histidine kinase
VIGLLIVIDIAQIILDGFAIGVVVNRFIDFVVGLAFPFYLQIRGEKMSDPKRLLAWLATFGLEFIPVVDAFPLWSLDGVYNFMLARARNKAAEAQEAVMDKLQKQKQLQSQQERIVKLQEIRERQQMANEDLYEEAA